MFQINGRSFQGVGRADGGGGGRELAWWGMYEEKKSRWLGVKSSNFYFLAFQNTEDVLESVIIPWNAWRKFMLRALSHTCRDYLKF